MTFSPKATSPQYQQHSSTSAVRVAPSACWMLVWSLRVTTILARSPVAALFLSRSVCELRRKGICFVAVVVVSGFYLRHSRSERRGIAVRCLRRRLCAVCQSLHCVSYNLYSTWCAPFSPRSLFVRQTTTTTPLVPPTAIVLVRFLLQYSRAIFAFRNRVQCKRKLWKNRNVVQMFKCWWNCKCDDPLFVPIYLLICLPKKSTTKKYFASFYAAFGHIRCV